LPAALACGRWPTGIDGGAAGSHNPRPLVGASTKLVNLAAAAASLPRLKLMASRHGLDAAVGACAPRARRAALALAAVLSLLAGSPTRGQEVGDLFEEPADDIPALEAPESPSFMEPRADAADDADRFLNPDAAEFDAWEPIVTPDPHADEPAPFSAVEEKPDLRPFDWVRHWGFHHSSTEGPFLDRGLPMERTSWLNRPYHIDWFVGPLLSDGPVDGRVSQSNELFGGLRAGWDFDYYWGLEWRFGWSDPVLEADTSDAELPGHYFVSDIDIIYYPWGDTKVRPYGLLGMGVTQVGSVRADGSGQEATLLGVPFGVGVQFPQTHWLAWRLEVLDNLAWGADGVDTLNNFTFTAGMEFRMGARPNSYWPWRSSRTSW
jgi:hypothetical protein